MKHKEFKEEFYRQIGINAKYFKPKEVQVLYDFAETIKAEDFKQEEEHKSSFVEQIVANDKFVSMPSLYKPEGFYEDGIFNMLKYSNFIHDISQEAIDKMSETEVTKYHTSLSFCDEQDNLYYEKVLLPILNKMKEIEQK